MYKHIVIPVDVHNPAASAGAMSVAVHLADLMGSKLTVVSITEDDSAGAADELSRAVDAFVTGQPVRDVAITGFAKGCGSISGGILECIDELGADLVVMASHDRTRTKYPSGSKACHVALHAGCSIMIVR